jgi:hypothetical protein
LVVITLQILVVLVEVILEIEHVCDVALQIIGEGFEVGVDVLPCQVLLDKLVQKILP